MNKDYYYYIIIINYYRIHWSISKMYLLYVINFTGFIMSWLAVIFVHVVLLNAVCSENADFDEVSSDTLSNSDVTLN